MDENMKKLNEDDLENVSGGNCQENFTLRRAIHTIVSDTYDLEIILKNKYGILANLSDNMSRDNIYKNLETGNSMKHEQVLERIASINNK